MSKAIVYSATVTPMHAFDGYELRPTTEQDRARIAAWIEADPDHRGRVQPDFFLERTPGVECYQVTDQEGVVFYFRMSRTLRVDIQFGPPDPERTRHALTRGFDWLENVGRQAGFRQIIFESGVSGLIAFARRRLGFVLSDSELVRDIRVPCAPQKPQENPSPVVQRISQEVGR